MADLETPDDLESIYLARGAEVGEYRPTFTGDIYRFADKHLAMILQHPCALRARVDLHPTLLAAPVSTDDRLRSKWSNAPFSKMPLPKLRAGQDYSADFVALEVIESAVLPDCERIAVLSQSGVNLLMQRWVHHSTRLTVPTHRYSETTTGPFDEADLIEEWVTDRVFEGADPHEAGRECADWLDLDDRRRRQILGDPQHASSVRREARTHRKSTKLKDQPQSDGG